MQACVIERIVIDGNELQDVKLGAKLRDDQVYIDDFSLRYAPLFGQIWGNDVVDLRAEKPNLSFAVLGEIAVGKLDNRFGTDLKFEGTAQGTISETINVHLVGQLNGNPAVADIVLDAVVGDGQVSDIEALIWGPAGSITAEGQIGAEGHIGAVWNANITDLAPIGRWADLTLAGKEIRGSGAVWGQWDEVGYAAKGSADTIVVAGIPMANIALDTRWTRPDSGAISIEIEQMTWADRVLNGVVFSGTHDRGVSSFLLASDLLRLSLVFLLLAAR